MNQRQQLNNYRKRPQELSLKDIIYTLKHNWYWFILSVILCIGAAVLYLMQAPKVYTRTASVLIKDNNKGGGITESGAFEDLQMFNVKRNVDNEMLIFKSKQLMRNVAKRLHLDISYTRKEGLRTVELYTSSPIIVQFPEVEESQSFSFKATPVSSEEIILNEFSDHTAEEMRVLLNDTIITPIGKVIITPSLYFTEESFDTPITIRKNNFEEIVYSYSNKLQVALANKLSTIINLTLENVSIPRTEDVLNTLIAVYNEEAINDKNQIMENTSNFIDERLIIIEKELGNVDTDIERYKRENRLTDIQSETGLYLRESSGYNQEGLSLENQRTLTRYIRSYLTDPQKSSDLIPSNTGISDVDIENLISEYNNVLLKRDKLITNSSDRNPVVMDLNNSLMALKQSIIRSVDNHIVSLDIKIRNVKRQEDMTARRISEVPTQQKHVLSIERQQKIKEELYLYLLNKREENALSQAITESNARIIDPATGSKLPISPKRDFTLLAAFILGIIIPSTWLWLKASLNTTIQNRKDLKDVLTIPFLGDIPIREGKDKSEIVVRENSRDSISESFRIIRTNMEFMRVKTDKLQVVMFTSFNPGAGKTFVSTNLAMSLALTNKKVILIDLDIRKGTLSSRLEGENFGMTDYLSGKVENLNDIIHRKEFLDRLDVIYAGPVPPNPAELLLSERLDELISTLREQYDYIVLDNVPSEIVADAAIVNRVADLTIYVIRAGRMDKNLLPDLEELYQESKFKNMAVVLNGVNFQRYGYSHYGYRKYGYSYGYGKS